MARPALHRTDAVLDAARDLIVDGGPRAVGIRDIAKRSGAPSGSLYHRFKSRDTLVALAWLRAVRRFQAGYLEALDADDPREALRRAVGWAVEFALAEPADTRLLLHFSQGDLLDAEPPAELVDQLATANVAVERAVRRLARRLLGSASATNVERVTHAVIDLPYAALRRHIQTGTLSPRTAGSLQRAALALVDDPALGRARATTRLASPTRTPRRATGR